MFRLYILSIALVFMFLLLPLRPASRAQEDGSDEGPAEETTAAGTIVFEGEEDSSLFVGHYRLNPGDMVRIEIVTDRALTHDTMLDDEGYIVLPVIGRVHIADLTAGEAREKIQELADEYYKRAWVTCRVLTLGKVKFYVYGDVQQPGFYTATGATTFFDFLQRFQLAADASHRRIAHVRGRPQTALPEPVTLIPHTEEPTNVLINESLELLAAGLADEIDPAVTIVDPLTFTLEGEIEQRNFYLEYGDVIYVPDPETKVNLEGFRRSGIFEVLPGETWADILQMAGAPSLARDISNTVLERRDEEGELVRLYYNLNRVDEQSLAQIPLMDRDCMRVVGIEGNVYVLGSVNEAGAYPYVLTSTPLDYLAQAGGPTTDAHLRFAVVVRPPRNLAAPLEESTLIECDLVEAVISGTPPSDVAMEPGDILFIPDKGEKLTLGSILSGLSLLINAVRLFE